MYPKGSDDMERKYVLSVLVNNHSGVLSRVAGLFSRRGYNITSLTVGETENPSISRMTIELFGDEYVLEQIKKQLSKLQEVIKITELKSNKSIYREILLVKVKADITTRPQVVEITNIFRARVVDISAQNMILEITGDNEKLKAFVSMVEPFGIVEMARTGITGLERGELNIYSHENDEEE